MTPELLALARSVAALPGWRWMPGMLTTDGDRVCRVVVYADGGILLALGDGSELTSELGDGWRRLTGEEGGERDDSAEAPIPDLTDAATGGCMATMLGPCDVMLTTTGAAILHPDAGAHAGASLAEACARVALARGRWA